jgi:MFS family permease
VPLFAANVLFGAGLFAHAFLYNFYLEGLGQGESLMGLAAASLTAGGLVALGPAGVVVDRVGPRAAFAGAAGLAALGLAAGALVRAPLAVDAAAFLAGMGTASWRVAGGPLLLRLAPAHLRARAFSWNVAVLLGSGAVWTAAAGAVPSWLEGVGATAQAGLRGALLLGAGATGLSALLMLALPSVERDGDASRVRGASALSALAIPRSLLGVVALVAVWMAASAIVLPFFNLYFTRVHGLPVERVGALFATVQLVTAGILLVSGELAARAGPLRVLAGWVVVFAPALWGLAAIKALGPAIALYLLQNLVPPATNPLLDQLLLERAPPGRQGAVSGWRNGATDGAGLVGAAVGGALLERAGFAPLLALAGALAILGGVPLLLALRRDARAAA